jgi:hypothetical protein
MFIEAFSRQLTAVRDFAEIGNSAAFQFQQQRSILALIA